MAMNKYLKTKSEQKHESYYYYCHLFGRTVDKLFKDKPEKALGHHPFKTQRNLWGTFSRPD